MVAEHGHGYWIGWSEEDGERMGPHDGISRRSLGSKVGIVRRSRLSGRLGLES